MLQVLFDKETIPFLAVILAVLILMLVRPSLIVNSSRHPTAPYCLNPWLTVLILLIVGYLTHMFIFKDKLPSIKLQ